MKVFALTALLISICCVQGALVKRQAEEEPQGEVTSNAFTAQFNEFMRRLQQETEGLASSIKQSFGQTPLEDLRTQIDTAFQQLQDSFNPLTEQMRQNVGRFFTIPGRVQPVAEDDA